MMKDSRGFILGTLLVTLLFSTLVITYITSLSLSTLNLAKRDIYKVNAQMAADGGLDVAMTLLNTVGETALSSTYTPEEVMLSDGDLTTTYQLALLDGATDDDKVLSVIGRAKLAGTTKITRRYELDIKRVTTGYGPASVVSGVGGLILNQNAKITGGDVVVNGTVLVENNAQIGLSTNPVNLRVAHQSCPAIVDSTYPQVCPIGTEPIIANGPIYADVVAQNQVNGSNMSLTGLANPNPGFPPIVVPGYDRPAHKAAVAQTEDHDDASVRCSGPASSRTANWPANLKIIGNVITANNCTITINGNVWISGNLTLGNNTRFRVADSLGTTRPVIMIDGSSGLDFGVNSGTTQNSSGTGVEFITTWWNTNTATNGGFTCGGIADPLDCTNVTVLALYTSQSTTTINFDNNASASGTILRSLWSRTFIANNGALGAVSGQTIQLGNNAVINFTSSIAGSDNLIVTWAKRGYMRVYQ